MWQTRAGTHHFGMVCMPSLILPLPCSCGCLAVTSLRHRCTVTTGDTEEVSSATQELPPGAWAA